ncbi:MAG TPA: lipopolysaccharide assembly protein LapA domain-containing protein [Candidatus Limnocylindrales bacterium]|nr:lipopolysaccharide assembly protein LapA domain-containing protein [Candidatus Limnocylindrales bacterium]
MWFLRNMLWLAVMVLVVGFAILNLRETVTAINLPGHVYHALPVNVAVFSAFALGMFLAFVLVLFQVLKARSEVTALERQKAELTRELDQLRNLPLEGLALGSKAGGGH